MGLAHSKVRKAVKINRVSDVESCPYLNVERCSFILILLWQFEFSAFFF